MGRGGLCTDCAGGRHRRTAHADDELWRAVRLPGQAQEHWTPRQLDGDRALNAWAATVRLISGGVGWPAGRGAQLDTLWFLALVNEVLVAEAGGWPFGITDAESVIDRARDLLVARPVALEYLAPFLDRTARRLIAEDLADTAGDLACLTARDAVWFGSQTVFRMMLQASARKRPQGKQALVSRETNLAAESGG